MSVPTYLIEPLEWTEDRDGDVSVGTILGRMYVRKREHSGWEWGYCFDEYYDEDYSSCDDKADGIVKANAYYLERILPALRPSPSSEE